MKWNNKKSLENFRVFKYFFLSFATVLILAFSLLLLSYSIPNDAVRDNAFSSFRLLEKEVSNPHFPHHHYWTVDIFTDKIMILEAANLNSESIIEDAMQNKYNETIIRDADYSEENAYIYPYGRYWHGYLVTLRPLLIFFDYAQIRIINAVILISLFIWSSIGIFRKCGRIYGFLYVPLVCIMIFPSVIICMQYSTCFLIMFLAIVLITTWPKIVSTNLRAYLYFFIIGMVTVYFDFLTVPPITLGMPLIIYMGMKKSESPFRFLIISCICWFIGYGGLWAAKWVLASILTDDNYIQNAFARVLYRTNAAYMISGPVKLMTALIIILICTSILIIFWSWRKKGSVKYSYLLGIALISPVWYMVLRNHSFHHIMFTYRTMIVPIYAVFLFLYKNFLQCRKSQSSSPAITKN